MVWVMYHFTPLSTEFLGPESYRHPGPPPPYGCVMGLSPAPRGLELGYFGRMVSECVGTRPLLLGSCSAGSGE